MGTPIMNIIHHGRLNNNGGIIWNNDIPVISLYYVLGTMTQLRINIKPQDHVANFQNIP